MLSSETTYAAYLVYNIGQISHGLDFPVKTLVRHHVGGIQVEEDAGEDVDMTVVYLKPPTGENLHNFAHTSTEEIGRVPQRRADGWMEIELGKFYTDVIDGEVDVRFMETCELHWKSGLIIEGIDIRPKDEDENWSKLIGS